MAKQAHKYSVKQRNGTTFYGTAAEHQARTEQNKKRREAYAKKQATGRAHADFRRDIVERPPRKQPRHETYTDIQRREDRQLSVMAYTFLTVVVAVLIGIGVVIGFALGGRG